MNSRIILPLLILFLLLPQNVPGEESQATVSPEPGKIVSAAREVMGAARYCTLVTLGEEGHPEARVVDPFEPEGDLTVWVATRAGTRKVAQIQKDSRVTLFYFDPESFGYVTLLGRGELIRDPKEKAKHWKEEWAALYKDGSAGDDYLLIRVRPFRLEIVSYGHGLSGDPETWVPPTLELPWDVQSPDPVSTHEY